MLFSFHGKDPAAMTHKQQEKGHFSLEKSHFSRNRELEDTKEKKGIIWPKVIKANKKKPESEKSWESDQVFKWHSSHPSVSSASLYNLRHRCQPCMLPKEAHAQQKAYRLRCNRPLSSVEQKQVCVQRWWSHQVQQGRVNTHGQRRLYPLVFPTPSTFTLPPKGMRTECQLW